MAEGKASSPVRQILTLILSVTLVLYIGKIYLRTPEYRHIEVCYLPHKAAHLFWVDVWALWCLTTPPHISSTHATLRNSSTPASSALRTGPGSGLWPKQPR